jgi:hypothetical protein
LSATTHIHRARDARVGSRWFEEETVLRVAREFERRVADAASLFGRP